MAEVVEGTVLDGRYRIKGRIGSGGMADVYCADDAQLGREVALKVLHRRFARDREFVERFRREASSAAGLQHPNVVSVFDRGEYDGTYYIAMEHLPGRTLKEIIRDEAPLDQLRAILYEMLTARVPFGGDSAVSIALKHVSEVPPRLRDLRPDVHPRLEQAVGRALLKDPAQRYASADEFIAALEQARAAIASGDNGAPGGTSMWVPPGALPPRDEDVRG